MPDVLPAGVNWRLYGSNFYVLPEVWSMFDAIKPIGTGLGARGERVLDHPAHPARPGRGVGAVEQRDCPRCQRNGAPTAAIGR